MRQHRTIAELEAGWPEILRSPAEEGTLELIVRRPAVNAREVLVEAVLDSDQGLVGDSWRTRRSSLTADGSPHPDMQITVMNARAIALVAGGKEAWPKAGDQLFIDLDLSEDNLPCGSRIAIGSAVVEVTDQPHNACRKFRNRYGAEAFRFLNSPQGKRHHLRGINARVIRSGAVRVGDRVRKIVAA